MTRIKNYPQRNEFDALYCNALKLIMMTRSNLLRLEMLCSLFLFLKITIRAFIVVRCSILYCYLGRSTEALGHVDVHHDRKL